jgi:hypothetical protein
MQVTKTYASKSNTISRDQEYANMGLNPIMEINYGKMLTRGMIYFDHTKVKQMVEDKIYPDINKLHHILKMTNCSSIEVKGDTRPCMDSTLQDDKLRAGSFDLIFFFIPNEWDEGKGFDFIEDLYRGSHTAYSTYGSSWKKYRDYFKWDEDGIYTTEHLSRELDLFTNPNGNKSDIIFAYKHFDKGNEDLELDITEVFNKYITGELCNNGFGIAFAPSYENVTNNRFSSYVGFFTGHTNSYFEPYVETTYDEIIEDDRTNFYLDKDNKLYFYASVGGSFVNLDRLPTCTINGAEYGVKQASKGIYYIDVSFSSSEYSTDTMFYDEWSNIEYKGKQFPDVTLDFVTKSSSNYFSFGIPSANKAEDIAFEPVIYGINNKEQIIRGNIRKINVECHIPYTSKQLRSIDGIEYRIYVKSEDKELDAISWRKVERGYNENYFIIDTNDFIPHRYYIDLRVTQNMELTYYNNSIEFDIVSDMKYTKK